MSNSGSHVYKDFALIERRKQYAKWFLDHDFAIFPIDPETKKPVINEWQKYSHEPLTEEEKKRYLEMVSQGYNYAIPCGQGNLVVLDFEDKEVLKKLLRGEFPLDDLCQKTLCVNTPHGGVHVFLQSDEIPPHKFNPVLIDKDGKGVADLQSFNSYVLGVGSCINHKHCTSNKCTKKGQDITDCYTLYNELREIGKLNLKEFLKFLEKNGKDLGIKLSPSAHAWVYGNESKEESDQSKGKLGKKKYRDVDVDKLLKDMKKYYRFQDKSIDAIRKQVCDEMKVALDQYKLIADELEGKQLTEEEEKKYKDAKRWIAIYSTAIPVVCDKKTFEEVGINRSDGDWRVFRALFSHGVTDLDVVYELLPSDSKIFAPKWQYYDIHTIAKAWDVSKPYAIVRYETERKKKKEEKEEVREFVITQYILKNYKVKTFYRNTGHNQSIIGVFRWDKNKGVYEPFDEEIKQVILWLAEMFNIHSMGSMTRLSRKDIEDINEEIRYKSLTPLPEEPLRVAFMNATIEWTSDGLKIYDKKERKNPRYFSFYYLPWEFDVDIVNKFASKEEISAHDVEELAKQISPKALETFKAWADEKWILLYEIIGYTFYPAYKFRKAFMLIGSGKNGKSTYINLIKKILGDYAISISPRELFDPSQRFVLSQLYHKLANAVSESKDYSIDDMDRIKRLTGNDWITADVKFKDPITFKNVAKIVIASNNLPHVRDTNDKAFWHRWVIVEFPHQFKDNDAWFEKAFNREEINGIVTTALVSILRAFKQERLDFEQTEEEVMDIWLSHIDSVYSFVKTYQQNGLITLDPSNGDIWTPKAVLYEIYRDYCIRQGFKGVSRKAFTKKLREYFNIIVSQKGEDKYYVYVGIALNKKPEEILPPKKDTNELVKKFENCLNESGDKRFTLGAMSYDLLRQNVIHEEYLLNHFKNQLDVVERVEECLTQVGYERVDGKFVKK